MNANGREFSMDPLRKGSVLEGDPHSDENPGIWNLYICVHWRSFAVFTIQCSTGFGRHGPK